MAETIMNSLLVKFIITCFVCAGLTSSVPLKDEYNHEHTTRTKRSPANNFSLFGIKTSIPVPEPISKAHQTLSNFGKLFTSPAASKIGEPPAEMHNIRFDIKHTKETTTNLPAISITNEASPPNVPVKFNEALQSVGVHKHDKNNMNQIENFQNSNKPLPSANPNGITDTSNKHSNDIENTKKNEEVIPIDTDFINFLFKDLEKDATTTEDSTLDYTTETGEYETTTDYLLRIPAPVVASLLG